MTHIPALSKKTCIVVAGPTAVGKTAIAIDLAKHFQTEIISADSRQCFREMTIGVAKPSEQQLATIPHHFINSHSIHDEVNAAVFESYALQHTKEIFKKNDVVILAGGTGLYIKAFCEGLDNIPSIPAEIREAINKSYEVNGMQWLRAELEKKDPVYYKEGEIHNPRRLMRALEVFETTGRSIREYQQRQTAHRDFNIIETGLELPRDLLYSNINTRVDEMMRDGLLREVEQLYPFRQLNALQTVGYKELFAYMSGSVSLEEAVEEIKKNTRHYAKRQLTWFKKNERCRWFTTADFKGILGYILTTINTARNSSNAGLS